MANTEIPKNLTSLEDMLNEYFGKKAPALPDNVKESIVKFAPWLTLIVLIISLPAVLVLFGIGAVFMPFAYMGGVHMGTTYTLSLIILAVSLVLEALAIGPLMKRSKKGWNLVFYSTLISLVSSLVAFQIVNLIVGALVSFYILFQIRSYYK